MGKSSQFRPTDRRLEATYSLAQTCEHLGIGKTQVAELIRYGVQYGRNLHPTKGGLWPTYKLSHKNRRVTIEAIERHIKHQVRVHGEAMIMEGAA
jgi:hypothetical protein